MESSNRAVPMRPSPPLGISEPGSDSSDNRFCLSEPRKLLI